MDKIKNFLRKLKRRRRFLKESIIKLISGKQKSF
jgi:hypothetical protein